MKDKTKDTIKYVASLFNIEDIQKYILGTKKNGAPRAIYDVIKDCSKIKGKKKSKKGRLPLTGYSVYLESKKKKKKGKKKKHGKHWHI